MLKKVQDTIEKYQLFTPGDKVLVAVSGGPDSVALLHCLWRLQQRLKLSLYVAHLNHGIRGTESEEDAQFVRALAENFKLPFTVEYVDVPKARERWGGSLEEVARELRHKFLAASAERLNCQKIALGHQGDDLAETVLFNLLRGSGLKGLSGIPVRNQKLVRPLLEVSRQEIINYCREQELSFRLDRTNVDQTYTRNKIRHQLFPLLEAEYNPQTRNILRQLAGIVSAEEDLLSSQAEKAFQASQASIGAGSGGNITLNGLSLKQMHLALRRRVINLAYRAVTNQSYNLDFRSVERVNELVARGHGRLTLPGAVNCFYDQGSLSLALPPVGDDSGRNFTGILPLPGNLRLPDGSWLKARECQPPQDLRGHSTREAYLERSLLPASLVVRYRLPGDRMRPLGMKNYKKLKDLLGDRKVPYGQRDALPLVLAGREPVWLAGVTIADSFKITPDTREAVHLKWLERPETGVGKKEPDMI